MSQAGLLSSTAIPGAVTSVAGTAPIEVNGVSGVGQTGNVTVSGNLLTYTDLAGPIDFTIAQSVLVYTPASDFYVQGMVFVYDNINNRTVNGNATLGINNPDYDNIYNGIFAIDVDVTQLKSFYNDVSLSGIIPAGTPIYLKIITPITATSCTGRFFMTGVLF